MAKMTYAIIAAVVAAGFGYYYAFSEVGNGMCKDPNFATNIATLKTSCPNVNTLDLIKYYERMGVYSSIPK
mgnify:CR=1 FL=1